MENVSSSGNVEPLEEIQLLPVQLFRSSSNIQNPPNTFHVNLASDTNLIVPIVQNAFTYFAGYLLKKYRQQHNPVPVSDEISDSNLFIDLK